MSLSKQFGLEYAEAIVEAQLEAVKKEVESLREKITSKNEDTRSEGIKELSELVEKSSDSLDKVIKVFLNADCFANQLWKGRFNRIGEQIQHEFLSSYIEKHSFKRIEFPKSNNRNRIPVEYKGHKIYYVIMNVLNNYDRNFIIEWKSKTFDTPTIVLFAGNSSEGTYNELKKENRNNFQVFNIDEIVEWVKQN